MIMEQFLDFNPWRKIQLLMVIPPQSMSVWMEIQIISSSVRTFVCTLVSIASIEIFYLFAIYTFDDLLQLIAFPYLTIFVYHTIPFDDFCIHYILHRTRFICTTENFSPH